MKVWRWIDMCSFPSHFDATGRVVFELGPDRKDRRRLKDTPVRPDCVVYCTGGSAGRWAVQC
jgi:dimethylaniline monooxygenase (N-oxide forming)